MRLGYNTNGLANHDPFDALTLLAEIGYQSVAMTLDHGPLNPLAADFHEHQERLREHLRRLQLRCVIETGARYLLNPRLKHEPTLVSSDHAQRLVRIDFLRRAVDAAASLEGECVSLWSGTVRDNASEAEIWDRLLPGLQLVLDHARDRRVTIGFEPEPGMFVDTMERFAELQRRLSHPRLKLTLDVGHLHCQGETPIADYIAHWGREIVNVHIEDMRGGIHEHLMFGEGEMNFPPIIEALAAAGYRAGIHVELSRHSHEGPTAAQRAYDFLSPLVKRCAPR